MVRPGVYVEEVRLPRLFSSQTATDTFGAFIGTALKGPTQPTIVRSWGEFVAKFGSFGNSVAETSLAYGLWQYFINSGRTAFVCRVIGVNAALATGIIEDNKGDSPTKRFDVVAVNPGKWGNALSVDIEATVVTNTDDVDRFDLRVRELVRGTPTTVETFANLSMDRQSVRYVEKIVNSDTIGSYYIRITDAIKDDKPLKLSIGDCQLVNGDDGDEEDAQGNSTFDYPAAFDKFDSVDGMLVVNMCGNVLDVGTVAERVKKRGNSILVADTAPAVQASLAVNAQPAMDSEGGDYTAIYYPYLYIQDPVRGAAPGSVVLVPPGASAAGMIIREQGLSRAKSPAGVTAVLAGALATETRLTSSELDALAAAHINVIRAVPGGGIVSMGARTRTTSTARYISVRRILNYVKQRSTEASMWAMFEPNTPSLWEQLRVANASWLNGLWAAGGLAGTTPNEAYFVKCDSDINTPQTVAAGEVHLEIGVAPVFPSEFIKIRIGQFESGVTVTTEEV